MKSNPCPLTHCLFFQSPHSLKTPATLEILQFHTSIPRQRTRIEQFLAASGLRLDEVDYYAALVDEASGDIIAGGGLWRDIIKCVAVADGHQGEALANTIVSHLIARANAEGHHCVKLYTKPQNRQLFESLSFRLLAEAPQAILMETGVGGIGKYSQALRLISAKRQAAAAASATASATLPQAGVIVMNANPFTLGHRRLVEQAAAQVGTLYVLIVKEDCSVFSYAERKDMVSRSVADLANVCVVDGSDYAVSKATFPTYFLKRLSDASDTQMLLDLDLYGRHIAPALGATVRFVGSEPTDALTCRYNKLMQATLPDVRVMQRYEVDGEPVSASRVRMALVKNSLSAAAPLVPPTTLPYLIAHLATRALRTELNTTPKPGLVDSRDNGSHTDMDHAIMMRGIRALHPFFVRLALLGYAPQLPPHGEVVGIGLEAERAMLAATGGVNTHKGALFALGLAVIAAAHAATHAAAMSANPPAFLSATIAALAAAFPDTQGTHGSRAKVEASPVATLKSALDNAREGYARLFADWLPFYAARRRANDTYAPHRTLLRIMAELDDTNIVHRSSVDTMIQVKMHARQLLNDFSEPGLEAMNRSFIMRNLSPGGSADMLSMVVFLYGITRQ